MNSTTLMTFFLRTDSNVRSVKLFGSWDNFSKPYSLGKDGRVCPGLWKGCYTFTDIICDGSSMRSSSPRSGGLKSGGTYWYYYLLDDDIEHYNDTEPATTHCPFLPGQPVNVLQVPILLPDSEPIHTHDSQSFNNTLDIRTMNPEDRYVNPRQPPKPKLPRLRTSLQQPAPSWSFNSSPLSFITNRTTSQPTSAAGKSRGHSSGSSFDSRISRSVSPPRSRGLRAALKSLNTSTPELTAINNSKDEDVVTRPSAAYGPQPLYSPQRDSSPVRESELPFRRPSSANNHDSLSIQDRRAMRSKYRDPSPFRSPLTVDTRSDRFESSHQNDMPTLRELVQEIAVSGDTSVTPRPPNFQDKRLPTLPNTPSSVMDEALRDLDDREKALDAENLGSHFSDFSATDESTGGHSPVLEKSRFSEWSTDNEQISPESMVSASTFNEERPLSAITDDAKTPGLLQPSHAGECGDPDTPHLTVDSQPSPAISAGDNSPGIPLPTPRVAVSGSPLLNMADLSINDEDGDHEHTEHPEYVESNPKRRAAFFGELEVKGLGLSSSPANSAMLFRDAVERDLAATPHTSVGSRGTGHRNLDSGRSAGQNATMQEMMDELCYLKNMIQNGQNGQNETPQGMI
ncbi:uncharacterized protein EURHEDRAFT_520147 [Aspergillus ruber CBS 135680]|uniref:Uncharacterized protein n=1 Tax=Aspergillus ruber (strain CBS 135680) TaxID=1388766 RepID=A0A017SQS1_ASPRC|nr:uncharacterized protein EURHEDRAFT_520147 [Aspergillus ruber CBS 135680]EYE98939.1 hypothetical protein EURHEDRAFT_520147 [Aspergillus ruber CBS 135680]